VVDAGFAAEAHIIPNLWDEEHAATLTPEDLLVYRSNLLGSDKRITNFGGGNTSSKLRATDPLTGESVETLWVKGSGGDLGSIRRDGFATLYLDRLKAIETRYRGPAEEDAIVDLYPHCAFNVNPRAASIDTPLHGLVHHAHIDHVHPDAIIAIAAAADGEAITRRIFSEQVGWLPWRRPGFELGVQLKRYAAENPQAVGVILASHGLFAWGETQRACYENTIATINRAAAWLAKSARGAPFGGERGAPFPASERRRLAARLAPRLRGLLSQESVKVGHFDDSDAVLAFVCSRSCAELAAEGTSCPDHFLRTKIRPLLFDQNPAALSDNALIDAIRSAVDAYRVDYRRYYEVCRRPDSPSMRDPSPVIILVPGVGMFAYGADKAGARIAAEFYMNAINVMRGATAVSGYRGLPAQEAFDIEYWRLEEAKLQRAPKPKPLTGRVALVTGGAGGIGQAAARRLLSEGANVVLCDIDAEALVRAQTDIAGAFGKDRVAAVPVDVVSEPSVHALFQEAALAFGGVDILVSNAGIASAAPIEETSLDLWRRNIDILATGYFLVAREAFRMMRQQGRGGSIVFVASKNALVASPNASAYCTAKAAEIQLARCLALEGAPHGIRANVVNPDAVLRGSRIWAGEWRAQRADAYKVAPDQLEEIYRERSLLKLNVYPDDVAEAVHFFASDLSAKSTGNILNVDAGHAAAFTR